MKSLLGFRVLLRFGILDDYNKMVVCVFKFEERFGSCDKDFVTNESPSSFMKLQLLFAKWST